MTTSTATSSSPHAPRRRLGRLGHAVDHRLDRLQSDYLAGSPHARADLAKLRRALNKPAGSVPEVWEYTVAAVPEALQGKGDRPSRAEEAAHGALTLFAVHQQSMPVPAHQPAVSFGQAVALLARLDETSEAAVTRRFTAVATAESMDEILVHVRGLVTQLRSTHHGFDYSRFADDLMDLLTPERVDRVRLAWGRDFYRTNTRAAGSNSAENPNNAKE